MTRQTDHAGLPAANWTAQRNRARGCLLGLAVGDALGTTLEFRTPGSFTPVEDMLGGGPFQLAPGQWTDDTSMALCLADSLLECGKCDPFDQMQRYLRWRDSGYRSSTGRCFDIGNTVGAALRCFERNGDPLAGRTDPFSAGNGSLMRLAPVPIFHVADVEAGMINAKIMSQTTHGALEAVDACRYFCGLILGALAGESRETLCSPLYHPTRHAWHIDELAPKISAVASGSFKAKAPPDVRGTGYVVDALEAALWAFWHANDFRDGALAAVNLGDDADTTGAIYGQIAGAFYGESGLPAAWLALLHDGKGIRGVADELLECGAMRVGGVDRR